MSQWRIGILVGAALIAAIAIATREGESLQTSLSDGSSDRRPAPASAAPESSPIVNAPSSGSTTESREFTRNEPTLPPDHAEAFRTDATGRLVVDETTRLHMEALVAQVQSDELAREVREQTEHLSPSAAREAHELMETFVHYQQAQRQTYPPREEPVTEDEALRELEGLHALREAHFGEERARLLYGEEEQIAREMIEVMRVENDDSLTAEEKRLRGQALREHLPGVSAIEKNNRESAPSGNEPE